MQYASSLPPPLLPRQSEDGDDDASICNSALDSASVLNANRIQSQIWRVEPSSHAGRSFSAAGGTASAARIPSSTETVALEGRASQELVVHVPAIKGCLDSAQFAMLIDVINDIFMAPLPQVRC